MTSPLLYSVNPYLKLFIQRKYRNNIHYVWCAETFDSSKASHYATTTRTPASSDPCAIYADLKRAVESSDSHCAKIISQRNSIRKLARGWEAAGELNAADLEDIVYHATNAAFHEWRPLIYVIPRKNVEARLQTVPAKKKAGLGNEFIIPDLLSEEFDVIEL